MQSEKNGHRVQNKNARFFGRLRLDKDITFKTKTKEKRNNNYALY